jgi:hypothetical protein
LGEKATRPRQRSLVDPKRHAVRIRFDLDRFERPLQDNPLCLDGMGFCYQTCTKPGTERHKQHSLGSQRRSASWRISSLGRRFGQNRRHQAILEAGWVGGHLARGHGPYRDDQGGRGMSDERNRVKDRPHDQQLGHRNLPGRRLRRRAIFITKIVGDGEFGEYSRLQPVEKGAPLPTALRLAV